MEFVFPQLVLVTGFFVPVQREHSFLFRGCAQHGKGVLHLPGAKPHVGGCVWGPSFRWKGVSPVELSSTQGFAPFRRGVPFSMTLSWGFVSFPKGKVFLLWSWAQHRRAHLGSVSPPQLIGLQGGVVHFPFRKAVTQCELGVLPLQEFLPSRCT
jgi:hypothetical protein